MQPEKTARSRINSKACDQCYRCKVKCTMELSGCGRCRLTGGVCTYSLGKWMGRPKKSSQQNSKARARSMRDAESISLEHDMNSSETPQTWEMLSSAMDDSDMNTLNHDAISLFSMGDNTPTIVEDCYTAPDECLIINTSDKKTSSSSISPAWVQARETSIRGVETGSTPSSQEFRRGNYHKHRDSAYSYHPTPQSPGCSHNFNFGTMDTDFTASPSVSLVGNIETNSMRHAEDMDGVQTRPMMQEGSTSFNEEACHCKCSQVALACLDKISIVPSEARYIDRLNTIQSALITAERLVLCTDCQPNMTIARCCFILGNTHELVSDVNSHAGDASSPTTAIFSRQSIEYVRRIKRRASMLFAGLKTLQDLVSGDRRLSNMQSEFLSVLANSWLSLPDYRD
ncbi:hypothetical protein COCSADRAFT_24894 [Bipolaris sorokiniana ND90Pr]|uniref:Zn(2)-C6 fungal-type domain-containing protein n=1 Tax=Cochliobolus sativus (strain ND90Pr / ATCC 201652) TaxID=665912 RepID=M2SHZ1_COCSN|nr:uncharacterized protein COCSADRAFT_24894 [Bipolaris sorokiniana ND90Pr]EMD66833.1 hypothetical protein COCSADRAFT_24894 [Bipolaris sorokiniana ND90Pr]